MNQNVKMYTLSTCSHCKAAKKLLNDFNVKYEFVDVDLAEGEEQEAVINEVKKYNARLTFPTILIGDKVIVGYQEDKIKEALKIS
ncbi:MAG: glutaredoxin family protein [Nitrospiraceae bacterium]|nr:glutaredoxin family protein [Nitrospiraceae bacterium]